MIFKGVDVELTISQYLEPSNIALMLMHNGEPYAYLTRNIGEFTGGYIASGFCRYPVYKISEDVIKCLN